MSTRPLKRIKRPGHVALNVPDLSHARDFYTRVINLRPVKETSQVVLLRGQFEHHCLELHKAEAAGVRHLGWETDSDEDTAALRSLVEGLGVPVREAPPSPGERGVRFQFQDPHLGLWHEVYRSMERLGVLVPQGPVPPLRLGHLTTSTPDPDGALAFFRSIGFRVSDWLPGFLAFVRCAPEHHDLGFLKFERPGLHHHAYDVGGWEGIKHVLDWMTLQGWPVEVGPVRHAGGNNISVYVRDPNAIRVEFYCEMELIADDEDHDTRRQPPHYDLWTQRLAPEGAFE